MKTATQTKGFAVTCQHCHDVDATVTIDLNNLAECRCSSCDETFSPAQARDLAAAELAKREKVIRWIETAAEILAD
jgi:hypothetical protein